jgi:hypothetical protein
MFLKILSSTCDTVRGATDQATAKPLNALKICDFCFQVPAVDCLLIYRNMWPSRPKLGPLHARCAKEDLVRVLLFKLVFSYYFGLG